MSNLKVHYFTADWCGPCRSFGPIMEDVQAERGFAFEKNSLTIQTDIEQENANKALAQKFGVRSIPTVLVVNENGDVVATSVGGKDRSELVKWLESVGL